MRNRPGGPLKPVAPYAELFIDNPKVSGNLLVGLRWGGPGAQDNTFFDPDNVGLTLPRVDTAVQCVRGHRQQGWPLHGRESV